MPDLRKIAATTTMVLLASSALPARAGSFKALPIKVFFDPGARSAVVKLVNDASDPLSVQLAVKRWTQDATGADVFEETQDVVYFPKMATLGPGEEKLVRLAYRGKADALERTYRLFVQELPVSKPGEVTVKFALTVTIPLFVRSTKELVAWELEPVGLSEERMRVQVANRGSSHVVVSRIRATGLAADREVFAREITGWYTLAGSSRLFSISISPEDCLKATTIRVEASVGSGKQVRDLRVEPSMCTPMSDAARAALQARTPVP